MLEYKILRTLRTLCLCGKIFLSFVPFVVKINYGYLTAEAPSTPSWRNSQSAIRIPKFYSVPLW